MTLDVLVFAAHPDDAEIGMGGTIAKLSANNLKVGIVDLTKGEMGTRGSAEIRQQEAIHSAIILKIKVRDNLNLSDGNINQSRENLLALVTSIRKYKPKIVFAPFFNDRHPDHIQTARLVKDAMFFSGLQKIETSDKDIKQEPYRPGKVFYYMQTYTFEPSFIVDISDHFDEKMNSIRAFTTQFQNVQSTKPDTFISRPEFLNYIEARSTFYGFQIGKKYGEPFYSEEKVELDLIGMLK